MNRRYVMVATFLGIAACASSGSKLPEPGTNAGNSVPNNTSTATVGEVQVVDIPEVPMAANIPVQNEVICHREQRPGSKITKRVCRTRAEIEKARMAGQDRLRGPTNSSPDMNVNNAKR